MKLLILGGTQFVGRHLVEAARQRGDEVSLFNRGKTNADLFPDVEKLLGDRSDNLEALRGRRWDAVIDTSGFIPRAVKASAELLADHVEHYTFISSISVYQDFSQHGIEESGTLASLEDPSVEEVTGETYGALKALCEAAVESTLPGRSLIIRPGLIVGPYDPTDRFTYWVERIAAGGEVLLPNAPAMPVQFIDGRDLAAWTLKLIDGRETGVYNATGPQEPLTFGDFVEMVRTVSGSDATFIWADENFLLEQEVAPFMHLPLWIPTGEESMRGFSTVNVSKAQAAGLTYRPTETIIADTLAWVRSLPADRPKRAGLAAEREQALLAAWSAAQA